MKEANVPAGKANSIVLHKIKEEWKLSNFTLSLEAMIEMIPSAVDSISVDDLKRPQPGFGKRKRSKSRSKMS